jgi:hypothetical protein
LDWKDVVVKIHSNLRLKMVKRRKIVGADERYGGKYEEAEEFGT